MIMATGLVRKLLLFELIVAFLLGFSALAQQPEEKRVVVSEILEDEDFRFEVRYESGTGRVSVFTWRAPDRLPDEIAVTLFEDNETFQTVRLRAVDPNAPVPVYEGEATLGAGSFIGVELKFEAAPESERILSSVPEFRGS